MLQAIVIDDEADARSTMQSFIKTYCPKIEVVGEADGVAAGYRLAMAQEPDLVFLDIQMDDGTGFDFLEKTRGQEFDVIFTTAFDEYAIKAFRYSAVDYLMKPIDPDDLIAAVSKVRRKSRENMDRFDHLLKVQKGTQDRIAISSAEGLTLLKLEDIVRLESDSNYTHFFTVRKEKITVPKSLKEYENLLPEDQFFRTHQSHIVRLEFVKKFIKEDGGYILMEDGTEVLVSRRRKEDFIKALTGG